MRKVNVAELDHNQRYRNIKPTKTFFISISKINQYILFCSHLHQPFLSDLKETPALLRGQVSGAPSFIELDRLLVVFCYNEMHTATAGLYSNLEERFQKMEMFINGNINAAPDTPELSVNM